MSADMKVSEQFCVAASKGNKKKLIIPLCEAIFRAHFEYYLHAWRLYRKKDIDTLERIEESNKN